MEAPKINWNEATPSDIANLIQQTLSGNNEKIKEATKLLKVYTKENSSIRVLSYLLVSWEDVSVRQMATVLLKRNISNMYQKLNPQQQAEFRSVLLTQYVRQPQMLVQKGIVLLIGLILPIVELDNWVQLKNLLDQAIKSAPQSPATFLLLNNLLYHFKPPPTLYNYLITALSNPKLAEQAMNCLVAVVETQDIDQYIAVKLIQLWQVSHWTQDVYLLCFQVLNLMWEKKIKLSQNIVSWICRRIISDKKLSPKLRNAGLDSLFTFVEYNGKSLGKKDQLLKLIVQTVCLTCSEPHNKTNQQQEEEATQEIALWLIQTLSSTLKSKKIYPVLLQASISLIKSNDDDKMITGYLVLASMSEGCSDRVRKNLQNPIMNVLIPTGLSHTTPNVRAATINALCYFSEFLIPDIVEYHKTIIPSMMSYMQDLSDKVIEKAIIAIDVFFESMEEEEIAVYLPLVIPKLTQILIRTKSTPLMRKYAMSAIGSAIIVSGVSFEPYVDNLFKTCLQFLKLNPSPQLNTVRAQNISILGRLTNTFCKKTYANQSIFFHTYIMPILQGIYNILLNQNDPQMRQACFSFFYLLANAIEGDFSFIFDKILVEVLKGCEIKIVTKPKNDFSLDSDSQEEALPSNNATEYDEKASAIHALGELAKACPIQFQPYFQKAFHILEEHYQFFYEGIRVQVATTYEHLTLGLVKSQNQGVIPQYKKGLPCVNRYPQKLQHFFKTQLLPKLIFMISEDQSIKVSSIAIEAINGLVKEIGPVLIDYSLQPIKQTIIKLLEKSNLEDSQDQQEPQEQQDTEVQIFQTLCDLIPRLAQTLQSGFQPTLNSLYPYLMKFTQQRDDINDNTQMVGCLSQCFKHVPGFVASHADELFLAINDLVRLEDTDLNRNIAYSYAEMFEKNPNQMKVHLQDALISLKNIFERQDSSEACKDNAIAALCRIAYTLYPPMPYEAILASLIQRMPFSGDQQQQPSAIKAILYLSVNNLQLIKPYLPQISKIFLHDLQNVKKYFIGPQLAAEITGFLQHIQ